jgi:hypothetical protein
MKEGRKEGRGNNEEKERKKERKLVVSSRDTGTYTNTNVGSDCRQRMDVSDTK